MKPLETYASELQSFLRQSPNLVSKDLTFPKLSIITPSFNQGKYLERTIRSVLNQQYPNLEYIIIDGGSTDESVSVIKKYERYLTYWVSEPDQGQVDALNKGFSQATGDWVSFQNSDDVYFPGTFHRFGEVALKEQERRFVIRGSVYDYRRRSGNRTLKNPPLHTCLSIGRRYAGS